MLTFEKDLHQYFWSGVRVPSVTQLLDAAHLIDYMSIPDYLREKSMERGTLVHEACQAYDELTRGTLLPLAALDWPELPELVRPYLEGYIQFRMDTGFVPLENELRGYNSLWGYAGTLDLIGKFPDGRLALVDHKSGGSVKSAAIQTVAYTEFDVVKKYYPTLERYSLQLKADGSYRPHGPYLDTASDLEVLKSAINIYRWKERNNA